MIYFLDFDRTLFDTDKFVQYLNTRNDTKEILKQCEYEDIAKTITPFIKSGEVTFAPGELSKFVYSDVPEFLRMTGNESIVVTYGVAMFQKAKVNSALFGIPRVSVRYTGEVQKGPFLSKHTQLYPGKKLFVDDKPSVLENISEHCTDIELYEIRRDGETGDGRWKVITSLNELP